MLHLMRFITQLLLAVALFANGAAVLAKKPDDEDKPPKHEKWQEQRDGRDYGRGEDRPRYDERRYQDRRYDDRRSEQPRYREPRMSLSDAVAEAERRTGGQALSAEPRMDGGRTSYRVKVLTRDGRVQILYFDAN